MAVTPDPRPPYQEEPRDLYPPPKRSFMDNASVSWMIVLAAACAALLIWALSPNSGPTDSVDPEAKPAAEAQPITPPAPVPATRPAPTP
jgi:hypothetical protein